ncbi:hypothetical protein C5748_01685 [Phyllobacterium phragmitis]|uniref:Alanine and proline-rich secreted protein Apa n=1 Tax=Phyllobacterium phragmitis TaxID=2670329 RepID=A0A2S9IZT6_9HYPH|nr:hypothetical protein [Phyllobacterium phragmitis]PRD46008.1 hypothetical protein C5748_01685 [Phyllobacterium phragmitis]
MIRLLPPVSQFFSRLVTLGLFVFLTGATALADGRPQEDLQRLALSEIQPEPAQAPRKSATDDTDPATQIPLPGPLKQVPSQPSENTEEMVDPARPQVKENGTPPVVQYDVEELPAAVKQMRERILEAAKSGNVEALRPLIGTGDDMTALSLSGFEGDPIDYLKGISGDNDGQEVLAILVDLLETGYVHLDAGGSNELYVWPYFFAYPIDKLTPPQMVELYQIITAGDYDDMKTFGAYIFYRIGISPDGKWQFFVAGD